MIDYEILQDIITDHELCKTQENELAKVVELLKADRLIELPCKVGTPVYEVLELYFVGDTGGEYFCTIIEHKFELRMLDEIGRTVFPTKEGAEAKLAELKGTEE